MRKMLHTFLLAVLVCGSAMASTPASNPNLPAPKSEFFSDDLNALDREFDGLNQLEEAAAGRNATYSELASENNPLLKNVSADSDIASSLLGAAAPKDDRLLGIPGFLWGFCFGLIGVVLVYVAIDDEDAKKREGKSALIGCAVAYAIIGVFYAIAIAASAE